MTTISPRIRRRARERALQFLFSLDFTGYAWDDVLDGFWEENASRPGAKRYAHTLIQGVYEHLDEVDAAITESLKNWNPERVARTEWNILRIAVFEMRYRDDVPDNVAINEALEVAKRFCSNEAPRFINGVLDRLKEAPSTRTDM